MQHMHTHLYKLAIYGHGIAGEILIEAFCDVATQMHKSLELCQALLIEIE